jgi:hypothetical protein
LAWQKRLNPGGRTSGGPRSIIMKILIEIGLYNVLLMNKAACIVVTVFASIFIKEK